MRSPGLTAAVREVDWRRRDGVVVALAEYLLSWRESRRDGLGGGRDSGRHEAFGAAAAAAAGAHLVRPRARGRRRVARVVLLLRAPGPRRGAAAVPADGGAPLRRICEVNRRKKICKESADQDFLKKGRPSPKIRIRDRDTELYGIREKSADRV
jgi:hypothetical protein